MIDCLSFLYCDYSIDKITLEVSCILSVGYKSKGGGILSWNNDFVK